MSSERRGRRRRASDVAGFCMRSTLMRVTLLACVLLVLGYVLARHAWPDSPPAESTMPTPVRPSASSTAIASTTRPGEAVKTDASEKDPRRAERAPRATRVATASPPRPGGRSTLEGLIEGGQLHPGKAFNLLHSDFDGLIADMRNEGAGDAASSDLARLYRTQIATSADGTEASLRRLECGRQLCAAEIVLPIPNAAPDPFAAETLAERLPRDALVQTSYADQDLLVRRFVFSIDPHVTSLVNTRRP